DDRRSVLEHAGQLLADVATNELGRVLADDVDRAPQPLEPRILARPDEALQQPRPRIGRDVHRRPVDADPAPNTRNPLEQPCGNMRALLAGEAKPRAARPPTSLGVLVPIAVPDKVQAAARPELDDVELVGAEQLGRAQETRQQDPRSLHFVRLNALRANEL